MRVAESCLYLAVLLAIVAAASVFFKNRMELVTPVIFPACAVVTLIAGVGLRFREIVEGPFAYLDSSMQVLCGAAFCYLMYKNGTFDYIFGKIIAKKRGAVLQLMLLVLFVGLPGMITGSALVSVVTTGMMVGKYLIGKGMDEAEVVEVVAVGALIGMVMPPLCIPAMQPIIGRFSLYPGTFEGFFLPCLLVGLVLLVVYSAVAGKRVMTGIEFDAEQKAGSALCLIPLALVFVLVICHNFLYAVMPFLGYPLIYCIGFILAVVCKAEKANPLQCACDGIRAAAPETALLISFGCVVEILRFVGTTGTLSGYFLLTGADITLYSLAFLAAIAVLGCAFGPAMSVCIGGAATYIISRGVDSSGRGIAMFAIGMMFCAAYCCAVRGSLVEQTAEGLEVPKEAGCLAWKRTALCGVILMVLSAGLFVARDALAMLMI